MRNRDVPTFPMTGGHCWMSPLRQQLAVFSSPKNVCDGGDALNLFPSLQKPPSAWSLCHSCKRMWQVFMSDAFPRKWFLYLFLWKGIQAHKCQVPCRELDNVAGALRSWSDLCLNPIFWNPWWLTFVECVLWTKLLANGFLYTIGFALCNNPIS